MSSIILDFDRIKRCGVEEAIFCESKSADQISDIIDIAAAQRRSLLLTRLTPEKFNELPASIRIWVISLSFPEGLQIEEYALKLQQRYAITELIVSDMKISV